MASLPANTGGNKRRVSYFYDGEAPAQLKDATLLLASFRSRRERMYLTDGSRSSVRGMNQCACTTKHVGVGLLNALGRPDLLALMVNAR